MYMLILGLVLFLGVHSVRIVANDWRTATITRLGEGAWKGLFSLASIAGLALLVWGFGQARQQPVFLWVAPVGMRHLASVLTLLAFILLTAAYVPGNAIKAKLHHPMVLGVALWALAHLLANGNLAHVILFGSFWVWAIFDFRAAKARDRANKTAYAAGRIAATAMTVVLGILAWALFAFWAHGLLIGVRPI